VLVDLIPAKQVNKFNNGGGCASSLGRQGENEGSTSTNHHHQVHLPKQHRPDDLSKQYLGSSIVRTLDLKSNQLNAA